MFARRRFRDRTEAGRVLAARLDAHREESGAVVLGLARGGVVVAAEIARALRLPLDVMIARKLGAPGNPELAVGAIAEGGEPWLHREAIELTNASDEYLEKAVRRELGEIDRARGLFREGKELAVPAGAVVILVDDGVATGSTVFAAIAALRSSRAGRIVAAIPVAPPDTAALLAERVDELVVASTPPDLHAVGACYEDFRQVSDEEVLRLLAEAKADGRSVPGERS